MRLSQNSTCDGVSTPVPPAHQRVAGCHCQE
jgi:hypothetical protein